MNLVKMEEKEPDEEKMAIKREKPSKKEEKPSKKEEKRVGERAFVNYMVEKVVVVNYSKSSHY
jgi:hypothetical protein